MPALPQNRIAGGRPVSPSPEPCEAGLRLRALCFRQIDLHNPYAHHDALEFADGTIVPLARLIQGQWATVLQLPSVPLHMPATDVVQTETATIKA